MQIVKQKMVHSVMSWGFIHVFFLSFLFCYCFWIFHIWISWCQINIWMSTLEFHETQLCETWIEQDSVLIFDNIWDCISISNSWCLMWRELIFIQQTTSRSCNFDVYNSEILSYLSLNWNVSKWVFSSCLDALCGVDAMDDYTDLRAQCRQAQDTIHSGGNW